MLHFLADIGDVCNAKLGSPYRKCQAVLSDARTDCAALLGDFNFLCDTVDGFLPLCSVARGALADPFVVLMVRGAAANSAGCLPAGELFCIVPSYVGSQLKKRLAERKRVPRAASRASHWSPSLVSGFV